VVWATRDELSTYDLPQKAMEVVLDAFERRSR
jgi:hypothetical protein